ncbi:MAG: hypothetical protein H0T79_20205, partial [Deltaproteobacteria bacterium]|nr:hypothetical protein [Deltaproteobacteria bacterium]
RRPGLSTLATFGIGAPMGRWFQAGAWLAASRDEGAGTAELRIVWTPRLYSVLEAARTYRFEPMTEPHAVWSAVAWFGATSH